MRLSALVCAQNAAANAPPLWKMNSQTTKYHPLPALDGLRGLACLLVIFCHAGYVHFVPLLRGIGSFGVMIFYTLSGFLMAYHYFLEGFSAPYWTAFLIRRFIRVYPAFFVATFGYLLLERYLPHGFPLTQGEGGIAGLIPSWLLCESKGVFWTIPVEIKFYLVYPLIAYGFFLLSTRIAFTITMVFGAGLFFVAINKGFLLPQGSFLYFFSGALSAIALKKCKLDKVKPVYWKIAIYVSPIVFYFWVRSLDYAGIWARSWLLAPLVALGILSIVKCRSIVHQVLASPLFRFIGHISYSLYLVHWFVINAARIIFPGISLFVFALVLLAGWIYYLCIESPCSRMARDASSAFFERYGQEKLSCVIFGGPRTSFRRILLVLSAESRKLLRRVAGKALTYLESWQSG